MAAAGGRSVETECVTTSARARRIRALEVAIDLTRLAVAVPVPDESGASAAHALEVAASEFAKVGITIERVLVDNGWA